MDVELDMLTGFIILLILFSITLLGFLIVSGLFTGVEVKTKEPSYGPLVIAYKTEIGPYRNAGALFTESYCLLPDREQIGIYYDDPEAVPENELRYAVGPILSNGDQPPSTNEMEKMKDNGFKIAHFPKSDYVVTTSFPFRTVLSIYIGIYKAYPAMKAYIMGQSLIAYPAMEIYTSSAIVFMMPLHQQDEFYVEEFQEEESIATTQEEEEVVISKMAATKEELDGMREAFKAADKDGSGKLNLGELEKIVLAMPGMKKEYVEMIVKHADVDRDMLINYEELVSMFSHDEPEDKAKAMYRMYDTDKDGSISKRELAKLMSIGKSHIGSGMMGLVWSMADQDVDGRLDYQEFCKLLNKYKMA